MKKQGEGSVVELPRSTEEVELRGGRSLAVDDGRTVDLRAPDGTVEIRIEITDDGPVLRAEGVKLAMSAEHLSLHGSESVEIESEGTLAVRSRDETRVESSEGDVRVEGKLIHLN